LHIQSAQYASLLRPSKLLLLAVAGNGDLVEARLQALSHRAVERTIALARVAIVHEFQELDVSGAIGQGYRWQTLHVSSASRCEALCVLAQEELEAAEEKEMAQRALCATVDRCIALIRFLEPGE
jgi:hypothetical protein